MTLILTKDSGHLVTVIALWLMLSCVLFNHGEGFIPKKYGSKNRKGEQLSQPRRISQRKQLRDMVHCVSTSWSTPDENADTTNQKGAPCPRQVLKPKRRPNLKHKDI
ncbi:hypothetical protein ABFA07_011904 [Porites harrisoni]